MLGWLQSSAGNYIAALPCETAASDWATNFSSAADDTGICGTEMGTRTQGLSWRLSLLLWFVERKERNHPLISIMLLGLLL